MPSNCRPAAVAGYFYPRNPKELSQMVERFFESLRKRGQEGAPKALIVPHAGYIYSGPIAASGYDLIRDHAQAIKRVVLLGPAHRVAFEGLAAPSVEAFETPLGKVRIDRAAIEKILPLPQVKTMDRAHAQEHSLEVHLPFLQKLLKDFTLVPLAVGESKPEEVAEVLETLWGDGDTLIVISSDLSHHHEYAEAKELDQKTSEAILNLDYEKLAYEDACGRDPICGLLFVAKKRGLKPELLDLRNSGDTAGPRDRVVGYASFAFRE